MALAFVFGAVAFVVALPSEPLWASLIATVMIALEFFMYFYFVRRFRMKEARYPLVPPEGKADVYFPRTKIPRPVYEDMRRAREQRRKFAKLDKMRRKKK